MPSRTKRYGFTTLTLSESTAKRFRDLRDNTEHSTDDLITELLDKHEEAVA